MALGNVHDLVSRIMIKLFEPEERRLGAEKEAIMDANQDLNLDKPHVGFLYNGQPFDRDGLPKTGKRARVTLHPSLNERMETYVKDHEKVWTDRLFISQMLYQVLQPCNELQDLRNALPNCIVDTLPELKPFQRTKPPAYTLAVNPRLYRQFEKILPKIEFYTSMKLFY